MPADKKPWRTRSWHFLAKKPVVSAVIGLVALVVAAVGATFTIIYQHK